MKFKFFSLQKTDSTSSTPPLSANEQKESWPITNEFQLLTSKNIGPVNGSSNKELLTVNEFLKESEMTQKKSGNIVVEEAPYLVPVGTSTATNSKSSLVSQDAINRSPNTSSVSYEQMIIQQSTPLKNLDTHAKALSKSKKLGNILKLASVRGAKSKSMKHKYSTQIQQHAFIIKNINNEAMCDICQKTLLNKKALVCKSKLFFIII